MRKHKAMNKWAGILILFLLLTVSCQDNTIYHSFQPVNATGWNKSDTLCFSLPDSIYSPHYQYEVGIRHKDSYPYRDIWLTINQDTIHLYLADSIGNWKGNGIGEMRQVTYPIQLNTLQGDSISSFRITHIMQDNPIHGIHDIGIRIKKKP